MKTNERAQLDYEQGFSHGCQQRKKKASKPKWFDDRAKGSGSPVSSHHGVGFLDGLVGKPNRYASGARKSALI